MARTTASDSASQDSIASYMDGVQVKIAEAYKPPRRIALPAFYNNKLPDVTKYHYDFNYETAVLEKISEWRKVRSTIKKSKKELEEEYEKEVEKEEEKKPEMTKLVINPEKRNHSDPTTILTPQPLSPLSSQIEDIKINGLDYSDFDNDTSSPFDNMELKSINDMEELAQVLQPVSTWNVPTDTLEVTLENTPANNEEENQNIIKEDETLNKKKALEEDMENNQHIVVSIVQELQQLLENTIVKVPEPEKYTPPNSPKETPKKTVETENSLCALSDEDQKLAKHLNDMGFPLARSARAIQTLGGQDNKKIVEYLLALQYLEDAGYEEQTAAKALVLTQFDEHKAKKYCENLVTLKNFGFTEDKASEALLKCDVDRDKALDLLIT